MEKIVWTIMGMSLEAVVVIFAVLLLRLAFRKLPKSYSCVLWLLVLVRLLCPATVSTAFSLMPDTRAIWETAESQAGRAGDAPGAAAGQAQNNQNAVRRTDNGTQSGLAAGESAAAAAGREPETKTDPTGRERPAEWLNGQINRAAVAFAAFWNAYGTWASLIWLAGAVWLTIAYLVQYVNWKEKVRRCEKSPLAPTPFSKVRLVESERISEPFVCGVINPVIYLPAGLEEKERTYILQHERMHIRHGDPFVRLLWQVALVLHWFNPFVWLAVSLLQKDMEMFCDESVMKRCGNAARKEYAMTLLRFSVKQSGLPFPVAFGESNTESRIHHILKVKKPALAASVLAAVVIVLAAVSLLTDPEAPGQNGNAQAASETESADGADVQETGAESRDEKILALAQRWASATVNRDGNALAQMLAAPSRMDENKLEDGSYSYGWSSPWPWTEDFRIVYALDADEVIIHYYANTSDPHLWPWREVLTLIEQNGEYLVDSWELNTEPVRSAAEFKDRFHYESQEQYGGDSGEGYRFENTPLDMFYTAPNAQADDTEEQYPWAYWLIYHENDQYTIDAWQTPETAAATHLYLEGGHALEVESPWEDKICLRWEFEDGMTDVICMVHPYANMEDGTQKESDLWVVENILEESLYEEELERAQNR